MAKMKTWSSAVEIALESAVGEEKMAAASFASAALPLSFVAASWARERVANFTCTYTFTDAGTTQTPTSLGSTWTALATALATRDLFPRVQSLTSPCTMKLVLTVFTEIKSRGGAGGGAAAGGAATANTTATPLAAAAQTTRQNSNRMRFQRHCFCSGLSRSQSMI